MGRELEFENLENNDIGELNSHEKGLSNDDFLHLDKQYECEECNGDNSKNKKRNSHCASQCAS